MKKPISVNIEGPFGGSALQVLRKIPGVAADRREDACIRKAGRRDPIVVEFKKRVNAAKAWQIVHKLKPRAAKPLLIVALETTAEAREILRNHGVGAVDGLGNAHVELPSLLLHVENNRRSRRVGGSHGPTRLAGKAGLAAQALLRGSQHDWRVQDLAREAGISVGLAHRVLARLQNEGLVSVKGTGPGRTRRVTDQKALLDLWAEEVVERHVRRTPAFLLATTPRQVMRDVSVGLEGLGIQYALTGAAAASLIAPFVTAVPVTDVWVAAATSPEELYDAVGADPAKDGSNIVFLQAERDDPLAFRQKVNDTWVVNLLRLYVDLRRSPLRGREQAEHLRREVIGF